jgi:hypothetical protein
VEPDRERRDRHRPRRCLGDAELQAKNERLYDEMLKQLGPRVRRPVVNPGRKRRGRIVFGDDTGKPR